MLIHHLALLGQAQDAVHRPGRRAFDQVFGAAAAARRRAAALMKNGDGDAGFARSLDQLRLRDVHGPARGRDAAQLVGVRVAEQHHLAIAARRQMPPVGGFVVQLAQDLPGTLQ